MPTLAARQTLTSIWPMILEARKRCLNDQEARELRRLCDLLSQGVPARVEYNQAVEQFCLSMHTSGIFDRGIAKTKAADRLLEYVDQLRQMLL